MTSLNITSLAHTSIQRITECFNDAFSDYVIKFKVTEDYLSNRWEGAGVDYGLSVGCFANDRLVGFMVHAYDPEKKEVFNCATGVIPEYRGRRLVQAMYEKVLPELTQKGVRSSSLEVIIGNDKAIKAYQNSGFSITRSMACFKGKLNIEKLQLPFDILKVNHPNWEVYESFMDVEASWEVSSGPINSMPGDYLFLEARLGTRCVGYLILKPKVGLLAQLAVDPAFRRNKVASALIAEISDQISELKVPNIDFNSESAIRFMNCLGLENYIDQYEMKLSL